MKSIKHINNYLNGIKQISEKININQLHKLAKSIVNIKKKRGRIFFLGVGGSAGNASHAVNDFRKLCEIECYTPTDNVSELTARINDDGWNSSFVEWLRVSKLNRNDAIFVLSVGGGNLKKKVSLNVVEAVKFAKRKKSKIFGIVGRNGGFTKMKGDVVLTIPNINPNLVTPFSESYQAIIWHCLVSHPYLQKIKTKW